MPDLFSGIDVCAATLAKPFSCIQACAHSIVLSYRVKHCFVKHRAFAQDIVKWIKKERGGEREKKNERERQEDNRRAIEPFSKFYQIDIDGKSYHDSLTKNTVSHKGVNF